MGAKLARLASPFVTLWKREPVLVIAAVIIGATVAYPAWKAGTLTPEQAIEAGIDAAVAFLIRSQVFAPATVEALGETDD